MYVCMYVISLALQSSRRVLRSFLSGRSGYSVRQFGFRSVRHRCGESDEEDCHTVRTLCIWVSGRVGMTDGAHTFDNDGFFLCKCAQLVNFSFRRFETHREPR